MKIRLVEVVASVVLLVGVILLGLGGCGKPGPAAQFTEGDIVTHRVSGHDGQVIQVWRDFDGVWQYKVRFVIEQAVTVKSGNQIVQKAFTTEFMKEFELKAKGK